MLLLLPCTLVLLLACSRTATAAALDNASAGARRPLWTLDELAFLQPLKNAQVVTELQAVALADAAAAAVAPGSLFSDKFSASWTLAPDGGWSALTLMNKGQFDAAGCAATPKTCAALALLQPCLAPTPAAPEVGVRLLKLAGGAQLRPHHGPGGRLVAHLGVAVPPTASMTLAGQELRWAEGELLLFDDSFEHSVQNLGTQEPRYILQVVFPMPAAAITIDTSLFTLSISASTCTVVTSLKFPTPGRTTSAPVPLLSLYNRVSDSRPSDWDACTSVETAGPGLLDVHATHGYGSVRLQYTAAADYVIWRVVSTEQWKGDPTEKHLAFGEFWSGILPSCIPTDGNCTSPTVMGKLQGPRSFGGTTAGSTLPSAGFVAITNHSYFRYIFYATTGDAVGITIAPSQEVARVWMDMGRASGVLSDNPNRFKSWVSAITLCLCCHHCALHLTQRYCLQLWTQGVTGSCQKGYVGNCQNTRLVFNETYWVGRSLALGVELLFVSRAIRTQDWHLNEIEYPNMLKSAEFVRSHGLGFGIHTLPYPPGNAPPHALIQDGVAPTYRSGHWTSPTHATSGLEDMGFWWGHDNAGDIALNGNPNGPCPQLVPGYDCSRWGSNMTLMNASWSTVGKYRAGGAINFGAGESYGVAKHNEIWDGWGTSMTLGLTIHPTTLDGVIVSRAGCFQLSMSSGRLVWSVTTADSKLINVTSTQALSAGGCYTIKLTYNSTSAQAKILIDNALNAAAFHPLATASSEQSSLGLVASSSDIVFGGAAPAEADAPLQHSWQGAMEEIYLKNVSTENRQVYIYTDNVRPSSAGNVRVFDRSTAHGRSYYAVSAACAHQ